MYIRKNNRPRDDPWGIPTLYGFRLNRFWSINIQTVICYQNRSGLKCVLRLQCHSYLTLSRERYAILYQMIFETTNANPV